MDATQDALEEREQPYAMKILFDLFPLLVFFAAFKLYGIFVATAASIGASALQVAIFWARHRRFETAQVITLVAMVILGGLTLAFHNVAFIQWKLTVVDWIFAALLFGSQWFGKRTILERMLGAQLVLPASVWRWLNVSWGLFFLVMGSLNLYIAFFYGANLTAAQRQHIWVDFKVFGSTALMLVFSVAQALVVANYLRRTKAGA